MAKGDYRKEPLWVTRLKLWARSFRQNWELFKERKIAIFGLSVIIFFAIYGAVFPLYTKLMERVYINKTYEIGKQVYGEYEKELLPVLEEAIRNNDEMGYKLKKMTLSSKVVEKIKREIFEPKKMAPENEFFDGLQRIFEGKYFDYQKRRQMISHLERILSSYGEVTESNLGDLNKDITGYFFKERVEAFISEFGAEEKSEIAWKFIDEEKVKKVLLDTANIAPDYVAEIAANLGMRFSADEIKKDPKAAVESILKIAKFDVFPILDLAYDAVKLNEIKDLLLKDQDLYLIFADEISEVLEAYLGSVPSKEELMKDREKIVEIMLENMDLDAFSQAYLTVQIMDFLSAGGEKLKAYLQDIMKKHIKRELIADLAFDKSRKIEAFNNSLSYYKRAFFHIFGVSDALKNLEEALKRNDTETAKKAAEDLAFKLKNLMETRNNSAIISNWVENLRGGYGGEGKIGLDFRDIDKQIAPYLYNVADTLFKDLSDMAREMTDFLNMLSESYLVGLYKEAASILKEINDGKTPNLTLLKDALSKEFDGKSILEEDSKIYEKLISKQRVLEDLAKRIVIYEVYYLADFFQRKLEEALGDVDIVRSMQDVAEKYRNVIKGRAEIKLQEELDSFADLSRKAQMNILEIPLNTVKLSQYNITIVDGIIKAHEVFENGVKEVLKKHVGKKDFEKLYEDLLMVSVDYDLEEYCKSFFYSSLPYDPITGNDGLYNNPAPPSLLHPLGTDPLGRDIMGEMMYSTPREFVLGVTAALITVIIGTLIGATAAYYGGAIDTFFMRVADIVMLFPSLALLLVLAAFMELTLFRLALIMGIISGFGSITIVLKAQALTVKVRPFIEAARSAGGSNFYIITKHIIPNILPLSFLYMMFSVTGAIFSEAVLSFFGLVQLRMSWGIILHTAQSQGYLIGSNIGTFWWLWVPPGAAITLICSAFYFLGRGLEEIVNPRLRSR